MLERGHCPDLTLQLTASKSEYLEIDGLGLGILRKNKLYENHVEERTFTYQHGDTLVLYTDGIIEAKIIRETIRFLNDTLLTRVYHEHTQKKSKTNLNRSLHYFVGGDGKIGR